MNPDEIKYCPICTGNNEYDKYIDSLWNVIYTYEIKECDNKKHIEFKDKIKFVKELL